MGRTRTKADKRARKLRNERARGRAGTPSSFEVRYATPDALQVVGPLVKGVWSVPGALASRLIAAGRPVPPPVVGRLLVDTGATVTSISLDVSTQLGLQQIDVGQSYGAHGLQANRIFHAHLTIGIGVEGSDVRTEIRSDLRVAGIPEMNSLFQKMGVMDGNQDGGELIGLLGRDFLKHAILTYDGPRGVVRVQVAVESLPDGPPGR